MAPGSADAALVGAIDQGTSSSRFLIFSAASGELLTYHQEEVRIQHPHEGWAEIDPMHLLETVYTCMDRAVDNLRALHIDPRAIRAVGLTNQRETFVVWDRESGEPLYNAIVWLDIRNSETAEKLIARTKGADKNAFLTRCGLPITTYFSAVKLRWLLDNVPAVAAAHAAGSLMLGTVDTWLLWNLTGRDVYATDVTNASRTMLMNVHTLAWDHELCSFFGVDLHLLPEIRSSAEEYGRLAGGVLQGAPISGILGDQQAALVGQGCRRPGQAKNTYGTGCFLLYNTGAEPVFSEHGLLTTVAYRLGKEAPPVYALEGSVAIAGAAVKWLRDSLKMIAASDELEPLARSVSDTHGCYFVPAFSGLFCPYWRSDARGLIIGLTQYTEPAHIARALLEAICFQTRELLDAMTADSGIVLESLQVDGGMTKNSLLLQLQADLAGLPVFCPTMSETTALGAAVAAAIGAGLPSGAMTGQTVETFVPAIAAEERDRRFRQWKRAVARSIGWMAHDDEWAPRTDGADRDNSDPDARARRIRNNSAFAFFFLGSLVMISLSSILRAAR